jgi:rSAM/selenodomain-associated transferase 2
MAGQPEGLIKISIIIPALNEEEQIEAVLGGLVREAGVEVIVVDGGSADKTVLKARACGAKVISSRPGRGLQMNAGAARAKGDILLFLHADTILPADFAEQVARAAEIPGFAAGAFRFTIAAEGYALRIIEFFANARARLFSLPYGDQALFLPAQTFQALGGYRQVPLLEDVDLVRRACRLGRIVMAPGAVQTSPRRWQRLGAVQTTLVNQLIIIGFLLGISPFRLARWYGQREEG